MKSEFIEKVFKNRIVYTNEFKIIALEQYRNGLPPVEIFINAGIDLNLVGRKNAVNLLLKWSKEGVKTSEQISLEQQIKELNLIRSMSRRGNCLDNAPIESFFGHLKDELEYKDCKNLEEVRDKIDKYIYYYYNERYQWGLNKMTPVK